MDHRSGILLALLCAGVAGCVAPTLSQQDIASVSQRCGVPEGLLSQDVEQRRFLILEPVNAARPAPEVACVNQWARRRHMRLIYIESIEEAQ
ncbi:hypothetical protein RCO27_15810 [Sphingosinicella sp. LHD-64]|uniref:hypothetical protein n=1 Tax=Sphingosinicella sp. LHD-64 TaxID=3072139 RepID=UPI00280D8A6E|nr:hypothetical protein [Sphingosinicella sp. LHD-64]MDQ8757695.1 hypothetical protein [Sphingosinicella sp. LHD-64]